MTRDEQDEPSLDDIDAIEDSEGEYVEEEEGDVEPEPPGPPEEVVPRVRAPNKFEIEYTHCAHCTLDGLETPLTPNRTIRCPGCQQALCQDCAMDNECGTEEDDEEPEDD